MLPKIFCICSLSVHGRKLCTLILPRHSAPIWKHMSDIVLFVNCNKKGYEQNLPKLETEGL